MQIIVSQMIYRKSTVLMIFFFTSFSLLTRDDFQNKSKNLLRIHSNPYTRLKVTLFINLRQDLMFDFQLN